MQQITIFREPHRMPISAPSDTEEERPIATDHQGLATPRDEGSDAFSAVTEAANETREVLELATGEARLQTVLTEILAKISPQVSALISGVSPMEGNLDRKNEHDPDSTAKLFAPENPGRFHPNVPILTNRQHDRPTSEAAVSEKFRSTEVSDQVQDQMQRYETSSARLLLATPGLGKTRGIQALIELLPSEAVVWVFQPTLRKADEFARDMSGSSRPVRVFRGRGAPVVEGSTERMCPRNEIAAEVAAKGLSVKKLLCGGKDQSLGIACPFSLDCAYLAQLREMDQQKRGGVFVMTHASLTQPPPLPDAHVVIIDEDLSSSLPQSIDVAAQTLRANSDWIDLIEDDNDRQPHLSSFRDDEDIESQQEQNENPQEVLTQTLERLLTGFAARTPLREIATTIEIAELETALKLVSAVERKLRTAASAGESDEALHNAIKTSQMPEVSAASALLVAVLREVRLFCAGKIERPVFNGVSAYHDVDGALRFTIHRLARVMINPSVPVIVLDGTADPILLGRALRRRVEVSRIDVERRGEVVQCLGRSFSTVSLVPNPGYRCSSWTDLERARLWDELTTVLRREFETSSSEGMLVVSTLAVELEAQRRQCCVDLLEKGLVWTHYGALRGINRFTNLKTIVLLGRKQPPAAAVEEVARAYFAADPKPFDPEISDYVARHRTLYGKNGQAVSTRVQIHPDARVNRVLWQMRQAEVIQAIDRVRPARFSRRIVILNTLDLRRPDDPGCRRSGVPADAYLSWRELHNGGNRAETILSESGGFLPVAPRALAHMAPDLFPSVEAAKKWLHRTDLREALARHIDHLTQMRVRPDGQRGAAWPMFVDRRRFECLASARVAFERMLGKRMAIWAPVD